MAEVTPKPEEVAGKEIALREIFKKKYAANIAAGKYDQRDLDRLDNDDAYARCFLRTLKSGKEPEKAADVADGSFKFRKEWGIWDMTDESFPQEVHERNAVYYRGEDRQGHPILYIRVKDNRNDKEAAEVIRKYIAFKFEEHHRVNPEQLVVVLMDLSGSGTGNVDMGTVKFIITCFTTYFPAYLAYMINYDMPTILDVVWKAVSALLSGNQKKKLLMVKKKKIGDYIADEHLWPHMR